MSLFKYGLLLICLYAISCDGKKESLNTSELMQQAKEESLNPIHPGVPDQTPFWNEKALRFINVPSFDFRQLENAKSYKFIATSENDQNSYTFTAGEPWAVLTPIWEKLPVGYINLEVQGISENGDTVGIAGERRFYRAAFFTGPYRQDRADYRRHAIIQLETLFNTDHIQRWANEGTPDHAAYTLYAYPSKIVSAVAWSMILYAKISPEHKDQAIKIARGAIDYLIQTSEPADAAYPFFPQTYEGSNIAAERFQGQLMMCYPARAAMVYLYLYEVTQEDAYYQAAIRIADTYQKTQLPGGTWPLKVNLSNGEAIKENLLSPSRVIFFLDMLVHQYHQVQYQSCIDKAFQWILDNPVKTFDWEAQFEDITLRKSYQNLTHLEPAWFAYYLFMRYPDNSKYVKLAEKILQFCEDQFVIWEKPLTYEKQKSSLWIVPCALEQYSYYCPITSSACRHIRAWLQAYKVTGRKLYLYKSIAMANSMVKVHNLETGFVNTVWWKEIDNRIHQNRWLNNCAYFAETLLNMADLK
jgi:maltose/maltodextrin transport system substrate-binding protein